MMREGRGEGEYRLKQKRHQIKAIKCRYCDPKYISANQSETFSPLYFLGRIKTLISGKLGFRFNHQGWIWFKHKVGIRLGESLMPTEHHQGRRHSQGIVMPVKLTYKSHNYSRDSFHKLFAILGYEGIFCAFFSWTKMLSSKSYSKKVHFAI